MATPHDRLAHRMSLDAFRAAADVLPLANHGRAFEVFFDGRSLGFADPGDPAAQAHRREVQNALYCNTKDAPEFMRGVVLPSLAAVAAYPDLRLKFPQEHQLVCMPPEWGPAYSAAARKEGWDIFTADGELQVQRLDEEGLLGEDADAWRLVFRGNEDHHRVARVTLCERSSAEWQRITELMSGELTRTNTPKEAG